MVPVLIHLAISTLFAILLGLAFGSLTPAVATASLLAGTAAGYMAGGVSEKEKGLFQGAQFQTWLFYAFILFAGFQHFLNLLYYNQKGLNTLHLNNFGDLSLHIQYIRNFASGAHFWPMDPAFSGALLRYPIGMDLYNALWEALGVPVETHLFLAGIIMTFVAVAVLHEWMGWWGVGAFFLNGGLGNWRSGAFLKLQDLQNGLAWKNFFVSIWITQRGFLFAVPAGAYVLKQVIEALLDERELTGREKAVCATLWAALAWFHLHTFFIISLVLGILILVYKKIKPMLGILLPVAAAGIAFVLFSTDFFRMAKVARIQWGWVAGKENLFRFWLVNLGPWLPVWLFAFYFLIKDKANGRLRPAAAVFLGSFFVFTFVMLAPWDWDNIKILLWPYLLLCWLTWRILMRRISGATAVAIGCVLFFSGAISVISSLPGPGHGTRLFKAADVWESRAALTDLPAGSVLAAVPEANHPAAFWGADLVMGYSGHAWSHGYDYAAKEQALDLIFKGQGDWRSLARSIGVTHIYWGEDEKRKYGAFDPPWLHELRNVSRSKNVGLYELPR